MSEEKPSVRQRAASAVVTVAAVAIGARIAWALLEPLLPLVLAALTLYGVYVILFRRHG